jgi:hypothetical protein
VRVSQSLLQRGEIERRLRGCTLALGCSRD